MTLMNPVQMGSTQLKPGNYKVEWNGTGNRVNVDILQHGKTVATTTAKLVNEPAKSPYDAVTLAPVANHAKMDKLQEIEFGNRTEALVLQPNLMPNK